MLKKIFAVLLWAAAIGWMAVIFNLSAQTGEASAELSEDFLSKIIDFAGNIIGHDVLREFAHAAEYFILSVIVFFALRLSFSKSKPFISFIICALYSLSDEIHQYFVPDRACQLFDILIDCLGIGAGILLSILFFKLLEKIKEKKKVRTN